MRGKSEFISLEESKLDAYNNYYLYSTYGLKLIFVPSQISSIFFNAGIFQYIQSDIDANVKLDLVTPVSGKTIFRRTLGGNLDLSWFMMLIACLGGFLMGFFCLRDNEYLKFLLNFKTRFKVFSGIIMSRIVLVILTLFMTGVLLVLQYRINDFTLNALEMKALAVYLTLICLLSIFFLALGSIIGLMKSKLVSMIVSISLIFILAVLWPEVLNLHLSESSTSEIKSIYEIESIKLNILKDFNEYVKNLLIGKNEKKEIDYLRKKLSDDYFNIELKKMEALENKMIASIETYMKKIHLSSILNPCTFYRAVNNELSSQGIKNLISYFKETQTKKSGFVRFIFDNIYYKQNAKVEPYLKGEEYVFYAKSSLPAYFIQGIALNVFYILIFLAFSYYRFKKSLFFAQVKSGTFDQVNLDFKPGNHYHLGIDQKDFSYRLYGVLSGKEGPGHITIDKEKITGKCKLVYLPGLSHIPGDIRVKALISLACASFNLSEDQEKELLDKLSAQDIGGRYFKDLSLSKQAVFLLMLTGYRKPDVYFFDEFFFKLPHETIIEILDNVLDKFKQSGSLIIEINELQSNFHVEHSRFDQVFMVGFDGISYTVMPV